MKTHLLIKGCFYTRVALMAITKWLFSIYHVLVAIGSDIL